MNWKRKPFTLINVWLLLTVFLSCSNQSKSEGQVKFESTEPVEHQIDSTPLLTVSPAANQVESYLPLLANKNIAVVANQTSVIENNRDYVHLVDSLLSLKVKVQIVFSPEHGFRGDQDAGAHVNHTTDEKTGLSIFSLHGKTKKPTAASLKGVELVVFDIQDVGVRFYTYLSTLHYVMEACAENNIPLLVLDRPNPNAFYISGPILEKEYHSFIGKHPVPVVYGMSIGEYALMINGEYWLKDSLQCQLTVIPNLNWNHQEEYVLPIPPSPNLNAQQAIYLYPHLCFFEGTSVSVGRGTKFPFQHYGHPTYNDTSYRFTPVPIKGASLDPPQKFKVCFGKNLRSIPDEELRAKQTLDLSYFMDAYHRVKTDDFFSSSAFFNLLAGNKSLQEMILKGASTEEIYESWEKDLEKFKQVRVKYLLY